MGIQASFVEIAAGFIPHTILIVIFDGYPHNGLVRPSPIDPFVGPSLEFSLLQGLPDHRCCRATGKEHGKQDTDNSTLNKSNSTGIVPEDSTAKHRFDNSLFRAQQQHKGQASKTYQPLPDQAMSKKAGMADGVLFPRALLPTIVLARVVGRFEFHAYLEKAL